MNGLPRVIVLSTLALLITGLAAGLLWWQTGNPVWIRLFFSYPGALFFVGASLLQVYLSFRCAALFSSGDLLRPAWFLIAFSGLARLAGDILRLFGRETFSPLFSPVSMLSLAFGLYRVLRACRQNGIFGQLRLSDSLLIGPVVVYTVDFFATVVLASGSQSATSWVQRVLSWTSDPLLCVLLIQAILIRRSVANMGWGLIARCWISFTAAIFATSLGDVGLWAWSKGYLPPPLETASWHVWFVASAAFALGPAYQLQAMLHATVDDVRATAEEFAKV
ncbi:MAG: hypothetical protein JO061_11520 [Acidobacteriaceae bacterium]|nr:hypothetical protein [Acidobacteriaceae bacterium]